MKALVSKCKDAFQEHGYAKGVGRRASVRRVQRTTTPPSKMHPTIVVPVLVAFGSGTPLACRAALRVWFEKSNPGIVTNEAPWRLPVY